MTSVGEQQQAEAVVDIASLPLFDRIGGMRRIEWLVDRFVEEIWSDPELASSWARVDLACFKKSLAGFFIEALGRHLPDAGVDSRCAHVQLEGEQFFRVALLLHDSLLSLGLPDDLHEELVLAVVAAALASAME